MITIHIIVQDAARAAAWYTNVLGVEEHSRVTLPDRRLIQVAKRVGELTLPLVDVLCVEIQHGAVAAGRLR